MPAQSPIHLPAGFAPAFALGYSDPAGNLILAGESRPVPVAPGDRPRPAPLAGSTTISTLAGPFLPIPGIAVMLELGGSWTGTVQLQRSSNGGATLRDVTIGGSAWGRYSGNACEPVWDESEPGVQLYLAITLLGGTLDYRVSQ